MKTRIAAVLMVPALCVLAVAAFQANRMERLFLAIPRAGTSAAGASGIAIEEIEEINDRVVLREEGRHTVSQIVLTYERRQSGSVQALQTRRDAVIIGTNHSLLYVLNHSLIHGGFFCREALRHAHNTAVLNKTAAFELFGSFYAAGNSLHMNLPGPHSVYRVTGVIDDGDTENINIYVPATVLGTTADTLAANFALNQGLSEEYIRTAWQQLGITPERYHLINFDILNTVIRDRLVLLIALLAAGALLRGISKSLNAMKKERYTLNLLRREMYLADLLKSAPFLRLAGFAVCIAAMAAVIFFVGLTAFERGLLAYDAHQMLDGVHTEAFARQFGAMVYWYYLSVWGFWGGVLAGLFQKS